MAAKGARKTPLARDSRSGQALIEFLPAILLFFIVIGASIVFFIGLRESFNMQVAARNALFAKIRNSGPLISAPGAIGSPERYVFPFGPVANTAVTQANVCFTARPQTSISQVALPSIMGLTLNMQRAHRATIFRRPSAPSTCD